MTNLFFQLLHSTSKNLGNHQFLNYKAISDKMFSLDSNNIDKVLSTTLDLYAVISLWILLTVFRRRNYFA